MAAPRRRQTQLQAGRPDARNGLVHEAAHDALSDVRATIALARLMRARSRAVRLLSRTAPQGQGGAEMGLHLDRALRQPFLHVSGMFPAERGCLGLVWPLAAHPTNKNEVLVWDCRTIPASCSRWMPTPSACACSRAPRPARRRHAPADQERPPEQVADAGRRISRRSAAARRRAGNSTSNRAWPRAHRGGRSGHDGGLAAGVPARGQGGSPVDVDEDLYGGFVGTGRPAPAGIAARRVPAEAGEARPGFEDKRLEELLFRYRARNFPQTLGEGERHSWEQWRAARLFEGAGGARTIEGLYAEIDALSETADERGEAILGALYAGTVELLQLFKLQARAEPRERPMPHPFASTPLDFPAHLEPFYQADLADEKIRVSIQTSLLCSLLYAGFGVLDFWAIPSAIGPALLIRAGVMLLTLCLVLLPRLRRDLFLAWYEEVTTVLYLSWGLGIMVIIGLASPGEVAWNGYYAGLILVSMALYTWTYLPPRLAALIGLALAACYIAIATWAQRMHIGQWSVLLANCFFLISANLVGLFSRYTREHFSREAYLLRSTLRQDLKQEEEAKRRSEHKSEHDPLTGLPNRLRFMRQLDALLQAARAQEGNAAVLFIDLDGFKPVNDTHGHQAGDVLLREIAQRIRAGIRGSDAVARLGGDEFVVCTASSGPASPPCRPPIPRRASPCRPSFSGPTACGFLAPAIDLGARCQRHAARLRRVVLALARVHDRARGIDHHAGALRRAARAHGRLDVAALGADARHQQRHVADDGAHLASSSGKVAPTTSAHWPLRFHFSATSAPRAGTAAGRRRRGIAGRSRPRSRCGTARSRRGPPFHIRRDRIEAHVGVDGDGVGAVAVEGFARVLVRGGADVAALGVEDQRDVRIALAQVGADGFELVFRAERGEIGDLRLEGAGQVGGGVDDGLAELGDAVRAAAQLRRQALQVRVQAHAQQGIVAAPGGVQFVDEVHGRPSSI
jgi:GGDEF domain-containing protein